MSRRPNPLRRRPAATTFLWLLVCWMSLNLGLACDEDSSAPTGQEPLGHLAVDFRGSPAFEQMTLARAYPGADQRGLRFEAPIIDGIAHFYLTPGDYRIGAHEGFVRQGRMVAVWEDASVYSVGAGSSVSVSAEFRKLTVGVFDSKDGSPMNWDSSFRLRFRPRGYPSYLYISGLRDVKDGRLDVSIPDGTYMVSIEPRVSPFVSTWYPDITTEGAAESLVVDAGSMSDLAFSLQRGGFFYFEFDPPLPDGFQPNHQVDLELPSGSVLRDRGSTNQIGPLAEGSYAVSAEFGWHSGEGFIRTPTWSGTEFAITPGDSMRHVVPLRGFRFPTQSYANSVDFRAETLSGNATHYYSDSGPHWLIFPPGPFDEAFVSVQYDHTYSLRTWWPGELDREQARPLPLPASGFEDITLDPLLESYLRGRIVDEHGVPFPPGYARRFEVRLFGETAQYETGPAGDGVFLLPGIRSGNYQLVAEVPLSDPHEDTFWGDVTAVERSPVIEVGFNEKLHGFTIRLQRSDP